MYKNPINNGNHGGRAVPYHTVHDNTGIHFYVIRKCDINDIIDIPMTSAAFTTTQAQRCLRKRAALQPNKAWPLAQRFLFIYQGVSVYRATEGNMDRHEQVKSLAVLLTGKAPTRQSAVNHGAFIGCKSGRTSNLYKHFRQRDIDVEQCTVFNVLWSLIVTVSVCLSAPTAEQNHRRNTVVIQKKMQGIC